MFRYDPNISGHQYRSHKWTSYRAPVSVTAFRVRNVPCQHQSFNDLEDVPPFFVWNTPQEKWLYFGLIKLFFKALGADVFHKNPQKEVSTGAFFWNARGVQLVRFSETPKVYNLVCL